MLVIHFGSAANLTTVALHMTREILPIYDLRSHVFGGVTTNTVTVIIVLLSNHSKILINHSKIDFLLIHVRDDAQGVLK